MFQTHKQGAALTAIVLLGLAIALAQTSIGGCALILVFMALVYGGIAAYKYQRDFNIIADAKVMDIRLNQAHIAPPMSSPGSTRLFVPPPIDRRQS